MAQRLDPAAEGFADAFPALLAARCDSPAFGAVGIDMPAGPSEVRFVADGGNDPDRLAADLLAQAEHDRVAPAVLITDDVWLADALDAAAPRQLAASYLPPHARSIGIRLNRPER